MTPKAMRRFGIRGHLGTLTVDHIRKRSLQGDNSFSNLITLCVGCHQFMDSIPSTTKEQVLFKLLQGGDN